MTPPSEVRVSVCVATYQRPGGLERLLAGLSQLAIDTPVSPQAVALRVAVADNDSAETAREVCGAYASRFALGLRYEIEHRRGITYARNRSVELAGNDVDFVAIVDDDEIPDQAWLAALLRVQRAHDADVVTGPVIPHFPESVPDWVTRGRFFDRPRYATGQGLPHAHTHNALVRRTVFDAVGGFDDRFALTGGEDLQFFRRVGARGFKIVWSDDAIVTEWIPPSRATMSWLMRRSYRSGTTLGQLDRDRPDVARARAGRIVRGTGRMVQGALMFPVAAFAWRDRQVHRLRALQLMWRGAGMVAGVMGSRYEEYRVTHSV